MQAFLRSCAVLVLTVATLVGGSHAEEPRLGVWNPSTAAAWWTQHPGTEEWLTGAGELQVALLGAQAKYGVERALKNEHFIAWMALRRWISLLPVEFAAHEFFKVDQNRKQFGELGKKAQVLALVSGTLLPEDDGAAVAEILCRISAARPDDFEEYLKLAIALAVVGDAAPPDGWPHPYVKREAIPVGDSDPAMRFGFFVDAHRAGELLLDPRGLSVRELCYVVDTIVELRELRYAQQIKVKTPGKLEDLYFAVAYDNGRIQGQRYQWPHPTYRLIDVGKKGGICADQAYFVSHAGKAKGVPTVVFTGQGLSGTHAWVGFLQRPGTWEFEAARVRGEKYPVGVAYDPQTWKRVTDAQLAAVIKDTGNGKSLGASRRMLQWAMLNEAAPFYREVLGMARRTMPRSVEAWQMEAAWLEKNEQDLKVHAKFWEEWARTFSQERDLRIRGQKSLLRTLEKMGDSKGAERLRDRVVAENRSGRFDLGISLAADAVFVQVSAGDWKAAEREFENVMRRFKRRAGGHLFYNLVQPYVNSCLQEKQFEKAEKAVENLIEGFDAQSGSILDNDMRKLISAVEGAR